MKILAMLVGVLLLQTTGCGGPSDGEQIHTAQASHESKEQHMTETNAANIGADEKTMPAGGGETDTATFGGGCFWCVEAIFEQLDGVQSVTAGYAGGTVANPTYKEVCTGSTGHAEVAQIVYDPAKISYADLLEMFWQAHDPTTLNRQGADVGTQYRSVIFYRNEHQREIAEKSKKAAQEYFNDPIVTEIAPLDRFWPAENYHQDYYRSNRNAPYCQAVIRPKLRKLKLKE